MRSNTNNSWVIFKPNLFFLDFLMILVKCFLLAPRESHRWQLAERFQNCNRSIRLDWCLLSRAVPTGKFPVMTIRVGPRSRIWSAFPLNPDPWSRGDLLPKQPARPTSTLLPCRAEPSPLAQEPLQFFSINWYYRTWAPTCVFPLWAHKPITTTFVQMCFCIKMWMVWERVTPLGAKTTGFPFPGPPGARCKESQHPLRLAPWSGAAVVKRTPADVYPSLGGGGRKAGGKESGLLFNDGAIHIRRGSGVRRGKKKAPGCSVWELQASCPT